MKTAAVEAVTVTWTHHPDSRQRAQPGDCRHVTVDVRSGQFIEQPTVVDGVTGEKDACLAVEQADPAGRMAGRVHDLENLAPQRDRVPLAHQSGGARWDKGVVPGIESLKWDRVDQHLW